MTLNGNTHPLPEPPTLNHLLQTLGLASKPLIAELNGHALSPSEFQSITLKNEDRLELVTIAAGG